MSERVVLIQPSVDGDGLHDALGPWRVVEYLPTGGAMLLAESDTIVGAAEYVLGAGLGIDLDHMLHDTCQPECLACAAGLWGVGEEVADVS